MIPTIVIAFTLAASVFVAAYVLEGRGVRTSTPIIALATAFGGPVLLVGGWMTGHAASAPDFIMLVAILLAAAAGSYFSCRRKARVVAITVAHGQAQEPTCEQSDALEPAAVPASNAPPRKCK